MRIQEEYVVPGLGVVILLSAFSFAASGASLIYLLLMGVLGLAAIGTYFVPRPVQVEVRTAIAVLGLLLLLSYFSSLAFWLALVAFGAIGALQIRHVSTLRMPPQHTVDWLKGRLAQQAATATAPAEAADGETTQSAAPSETEAGGTTQVGAPVAPPIDALRKRLRTNVGGIGGSVLGLFILLFIFTMPWVALVVSVEFAGQSESDIAAFSFMEAARAIDEETGDVIPRVLFILLAAVTLVGVASVVLPRIAVVTAGIAGMVLSIVSYVYIFGSFSEGGAGGEYLGVNVSLFTLPNIGFFFAGTFFFVMTILQIIPPFNRTKKPAQTDA